MWQSSDNFKLQNLQYYHASDASLKDHKYEDWIYFSDSII